MSKKLEWAAEKAAYARMARAILDKDTPVLDGDPNIAPGYATADGKIYITKDDDLWEGKSDIEKITYRKGIFTHELMHQKFTNFKKTKFVSDGMPKRERMIFQSLQNSLEDPAIEYLAPSVVGGPMLKALKFAIYNTYVDSPRIDDPRITSPYSQYQAALIQYGDMGILKGSFTFPEAKEMFLKTADLFYEGIIEPNGGKRVDISKELHEITRPLWEPELKKSEEEVEQFLKELATLLKEFGKSESDGDGSGETPSTEGLSEDKNKSKARKGTVIKVSKEVFDALSKNASKNKSADGESSVTIECDEQSGSDSKENSEGEGSSGKEDSSDKEGSSEGKSSSKDKDNNGDKAKNSEIDDDGFEKGHREEANDNPSNITYSDAKMESADFEGQIDTREYLLTDEDIEYIQKENERIQKSYEEKESKGLDEDAKIEDFDIETPSLRGLSCINNNINTCRSVAAEYEELVKKYTPNIRSTVAQLKKIFEQDYEDREYRQSGRISIKRVNSGKVTPRIFDRSRVPTGKRDVAVAILVDESGSMSSRQKYAAARESCIALAEIFEKLDIPIYVMGFTADEQSHDIVHNHYIKWVNTPKTRQLLLNISARSNNCDGYSIRYITKVLKKRKEQNKLLIVLSDGQPAARAYGYGKDGIADTKAAIREAKKFANVLGVAIGNSDTETIQSMYEKNFLHISETNDLFVNLSKEIKNIFKKI